MKDIIGTMMPLLNEYQRRIFVSVISENLGWGSAGEIAEFTGFSTQTLTRGRKEVEGLARDPKARTRPCEERRVRAEGGGRRSKTDDDPRIVTEILKMLDGNTVGDPMSLLTWTTKSTRRISDELKALGIDVSYNIVNKVLKTEGFSLQQNKKYVQTGDPGPDRDAQFKFIKDECEAMASQGEPTISVDTKKKELVGNYKNGGREYRPKGDPRLVNDHDFEGELGKAVPYGVYDVNADEGYVNVGIGPDTAEFAVNSIRTWWQRMGRERYRDAHVLMITADCGGSNGRRNRLWKTELQKLADETKLEIRVRHYPPGTSKWNKIEHRMFSHISMNWAGRPLESLEVIVNLIGSTKSRSGLRIDCGLDKNDYRKGIKVTDEELEKVNLFEDEFHGEWNYRILP
ncbi:MAG: ISAzo13 family transposase, partial [archaeon]|nr:ISAzo13 family transposase [archaeon]